MSEEVRDKIIALIRERQVEVQPVIDNLIVVERYGHSATIDISDTSINTDKANLPFVIQELDSDSCSAIVTYNGFLLAFNQSRSLSAELWYTLSNALFRLWDERGINRSSPIAVSFRVTGDKTIEILSVSARLNLLDLYSSLESAEFLRFLDSYLGAVLALPVVGPIYAHRSLSEKGILELNQSAQRGYAEDLFYKPVGIDLEILNKCTLECPECAILEEVKRGDDYLETGSILTLLSQARELGMYAYSVTGGEPFIRFNDICEIVSRNPELDCFKIQTNGSFFHTVDKSRDLISKLVASGFGVQNRYITSTLMCSVGIQNYSKAVTTNNLINLLVALQELEIWRIAPAFRLGIGLSVRSSEDLAERDLELRRLVSSAVRVHGLYSSIHFSIYPIQYALSEMDNPTPEPVIPFDEILEIQSSIWPGCFRSEETVFPRPIVKANGNLYTCGCFGYGFKAGNISTEKLSDLVAAANKNELYRIIHDHGVAGGHALGLFPNSAKLTEQSVPASIRICSLCGLLCDSSDKRSSELVTIKRA